MNSLAFASAGPITWEAFGRSINQLKCLTLEAQIFEGPPSYDPLGVISNLFQTFRLVGQTTSSPHPPTNGYFRVVALTPPTSHHELRTNVVLG
jgi:hypothetical protein